MNVRPATENDVPLVLPMVAKICAFHERIDPAKYGFRSNPQDKYDGWLRARSADARSVFLVADATNTNQPLRLAAFLIGTIEKEIPIYRLTEYGFIHDLWVEEDYRHEGLARQMTTLAIERFREAGVTQIRLDVVHGNEAAGELFAACGFRPTTTEMLYEI